MWKSLSAFIPMPTLVTLATLVTSCIIQKPAKELPLASFERPVPVILPARRDLVERAAFIGFAEPQKLVTAHFLIAGRVSHCKAKEGQRIRKGDEICSLDTSAVELEVARAENAVKAAERVLETNLFEKQKALFEAGVIGQADFEQVRVQSETAKANQADALSLLEIAKKKRKEHTLLAPWDGIVSKLIAKPGQPMSPEMPAAILSNAEGMQIVSDLHASFFSRLKPGSRGRVTAVSSRTLEHPVDIMVAEKSPTISPQTQSFRVSLEVKSTEDVDLATGIMVTGDLELQRKKKVLTLPEQSLSTWHQDGNATVFTVTDNGILTETKIKTGVLSEGWIEVVSGLDENSRVARRIAPDFVDGMQVKAQMNDHGTPQ